MQITQPENVGLSSVRLQRLNSRMQTYIDDQTFGGIITLVARQGQVAHLETFGWQDREAGTLMNVDTIFRIYSMTKPVTSVAAMMLVEEGRLRMADPISRWLPEYKDAKVMVPCGGGDYDLIPARREVTVKDLFTHTGGLSYGFNPQSALDILFNMTMEKMHKEVEPVLESRMKFFAAARLPLASEPGTAWRYSVSIDLLGYIIQKVSGRMFEEFLQERIFGPLKMVDTAFWVPPEKAHRLAAVYGPSPEGGIMRVEPFNEYTYHQPNHDPSGGGGLVSTVGDYLRFAQMLLNNGELDGQRLLGSRTAAWMRQNHLPPGLFPQDEPWKGFGLGGSVLLNPGLSPTPGSIGKFGWGGAANTDWFIDPAEGLLGILMLQYMPGWTIPIADDFITLTYQALE